MTNQPQHGGKRTGAGRKPKSPDERRSHVFAIKLTADEKALLDKTSAREWAREVLIRSALKRS